MSKKDIAINQSGKAKVQTLISAVMASLIIIGGISSLVGCDNNSSSNVGGNISGDASNSSKVDGGEPSEDSSSAAVEDLFNYKDLRFPLCDFTISFPRNWQTVPSSNTMEIRHNYYEVEEKKRDREIVEDSVPRAEDFIPSDYFLVGGYDDRYYGTEDSPMELPTSFDDIVEKFKPYLAYGITSIRNMKIRSMEQTVEKTEEVEVNGRKMLKVEGRIRGVNSDRFWKEEIPTRDFKYYAYYTFIDADSSILKMDNCPIFWLGMTELEENYEIMEKYVDEAAKTMKNIER